MRFELYDTNGVARIVEGNIELPEMQMRLSEFKTHCAVNQSMYEFHHFVNWMKKNYNVDIKQVSREAPLRVDM